MIPLTLAQEIRATLLDYLTTTFNFQDVAVEDALLEFLQDPQRGLFKGPYLHLRLPFRKIAPDAPSPLVIRPSFTPYVHQQRAFERLTAQDGHAPQPTLITTGTGSGKTECFLYPILDYCYARRGEPGIKAIILYPMNALAADQSARLAKILWNDERLRGQVTAGLYIGGLDTQHHRAPGPDYMIDDREALRKHPPDILLTNYKMLDFLLLRPDDKTLWAENEPDTLRYLVLDELHTYDGAQGSDVACLIRRLRARLNCPEGVLSPCPVGTSATVASEAGDTLAELTHFAGQVFGVPFSADSVIGEERETLDEFLPDPPTREALPESPDLLQEQTGEKMADTIARLSRLWFDAALDPLQLAEGLRGHSFLRTLLACARDQISLWDDLIARVARWEAAFAARAPQEQRMLLQSFLALVSCARAKDKDRLEPFLTCQAQLWVREMSRLMREVSAQPSFFWRDDVPLHSDRRGLPAYFCRDCGHTGWLALLRPGDDVVTDDHAEIYNAYFEHHKNVRYIYPLDVRSLQDRERLIVDRLCPQCLAITDKERCAICERETVPVKICHELSAPQGTQPARDLQRCPLCGTDGALGIVGSQAASLSSVAISHLYTAPLNDDKKLLAFTDSVQDASHRAAFFGARTYRFSLRTAFQAALTGDAPVPLEAFTDKVLAHWRNEWRARPDCDQHLVATFMPPDLRQMQAYRQFIDNPPGPLPPDLESDVRLRLSWEVAMEYGLNARLGRSLEKVGSSVAFLDPARLRAVVEKLALVLPEEIGLLRDAPPDALRHFVVGLLERARVRGGVAHPLLERYAREQGNWYMLTKKIQPLLSPFHKRSPRFPKFLTDTSERDVFDLFLTIASLGTTSLGTTRNRGARRTWHVDWAQRTLARALGVQEINEVYRSAIALLAREGVLREYRQGHASAYGLEPGVLLVTRQTAGVTCDVCGHQQTVTAETLSDWLGRPCLSYQCAGHYAPQTRSAQHYYRAVYERGEVERIFTHEHTGLLARSVREEVEKQFKEQNRADAANLLTATPTLELGIDVGDLSATMACSVPPATANYLQRIGRAGRKTGNSIILTLANVQPHDLYFFEEPLEMMAGSIVPPGCFLDAPEMLKRQFLAFCMDTWTATDPQASRLPHDVQKMLAAYPRGGFPENLLAFCERHKAELTGRFLAMFGDVISPANQARLRDAQPAEEGELPRRVRAALAEVEAERQDLRAARRQFKERRDKLAADPAQVQNPQDEIKRLEGEMNLLVAMIRELEDKYVLNFFTDAGLLPNYAFPETGVKLKAIITGLESVRADGTWYEVKEYLRAAPLAIRELAPFNTFYAEGRKLTINHVDVAGRDKAVERWQFCDQCSYMELVQASPYRAACPVCGSPMWKDRGQQHDMLRLRQVSSRVEHHESLVGDDADERERQRYQTGRYFIIPAHTGEAFVLPGLPFGFEYLPEVTLREVNFGLADTVGQEIAVAGEERPEQGFQVCQDCGLVVDAHQDSEGSLPRHTRGCLSKASKRSPEWHNLYLYREMTSEALCILLPVSTTLVEEKLATFEACLDLGLRRMFRGDPEHLQILPHSEPLPDGTRRRFLVIYDSVPGGTSFLRDLARPDRFFEVLRLALDSLISCRCRLDPQKKACYRCLYSYRAQRDLKLISRSLGVEMLGEILAAQPQLETLPSLSAVQLDSLIESELEQRLIDALSRHAQETPGCRWNVTLVNGKKAWEIELGDARWRIEPQVSLGPAQGVSVPSQADFVCWPQAVPRMVNPVAVFTDGLAYHVRPREPRGQVSDDALKRAALVDSGQFVAWSITWDDVKEFEDQAPFGLHLFAADQNKFEHVARESRSPLSARLMRENAVAQLLEYLRFPERAAWTQTVFRMVIASLTPLRPPVEAGLVTGLAEALRTQPDLPDLAISKDALPGEQVYGILEHGSNHLLIHVSQANLRDPDALSVTLRLDDTEANRAEADFRHAWREFLLLFNLYQFLPGFVPVTTESVQQFERPRVEEQKKVPDEWASVFQYASPECMALLQACLQADVPPPIVGYELADQAGHIIAQAELAWEDRRVAVFLPSQPDDRSKFAEAGWQTFSPAAPDAARGVAALAGPGPDL